MIRCERVKVKTDASGVGDVQSVRSLAGRIVEIRVPGTSLNHASETAEWTVTRKEDAGPVLAVTGKGPLSRAPRGATHDVSGAAAVYASGGAGVFAEIPISGHLRVQVAKAKASAEGDVLVYYNDAE
jgi:hypothetical protein